MSSVNLLPPDLRQRQATKRLTTLVSLVGVLALVVIGFLYFLQSMNLSRANRDLEAQQAVNAGKQAEIADLQKFAELRSQVQGKRDLVDTVVANEVSWSDVLLHLARALPGPAYLTGVTGQVTAPTGTALPVAAPVTGTATPTNLVEIGRASCRERV